MNAAPLLSLTAVSKTFVRSSDAAERLVRLFSRRQPPELVRAVDTVDLAIRQGEVIGLVGEFGCGEIDARAYRCRHSRTEQRQR